MFSVGIVTTFVLLGLYLLILRAIKVGNSQWDKNHDAASCSLGFGIVALVIAGLWLIIGIVAPYTKQIADFTQVKGTLAQVALYKERRDNLVAMVKTELTKYPEYEKTVLGKITPEILLSFPTLRSNETIVKTVEEIVKLEDAVYKIRAELIKTQTEMFFREISPWVLYVTPYQALVGEANPVTVK